MRQDAGRSDCDRCHAPLREVAPGNELVAAEGVTCDVCHTIRDARPDPQGAVLEYDTGSAVRYGPLCDREDHYFHKMGCSPLHARSELCGACHLWTTHTSAGSSLDVLSTFSDWRDGPYATIDQTCQGCHMHSSSGEIAVGWGTRASASDHGMFGVDDELRRRAVALDVSVATAQQGARVVLSLTITNEGAGHAIPTGLPGRRLVASVVMVDAADEPIAQQRQAYGRILVDADGREVPFYAAKRVASDTRLGPNEQREEQFSFASAGVAEVRVELSSVELSAAIAEVVGVPAPEPILLAQARAIKVDGQWEVQVP